MELFELADVENFAHLPEIRRRIAGPEIGKDRSALIDVVGGRDALNLRRLHPMINLGPFLVVLGPAPGVDDRLPYLVLAVERGRHPGMPVFGIPEHDDAAVRMIGPFGYALDHRHAADRPNVI